MGKKLLFICTILFFLVGCGDKEIIEEGHEIVVPGEQGVYVPTSGTFIERIKEAKIDGKLVVDDVTRLSASPFFLEGRYMIYFIQPVEHENTSSRTFTQRVVVDIANFEKPVIFVTQGYGLGDGWGFEDPYYTEELVDLLGCNQVIVEHRYFEESTPYPLDWTYHTVENEVYDLHRINLVMREIFKDQKFISTGRSKGGQTAIYYESYFPEDIDISVPYVAPICYQMNDMRHAEFLKNVGDVSRRTKIKNIQQAAFDRRAQLLPYFRVRFDPTIFNAEQDIIFDLCVLEYSFMCWQYNPQRSIPDASQLSDIGLMNEILSFSPMSYFSFIDNPSFIMNIMRDGGYYGYDVTQFSNTVITQEQCNRWVEDIAVPKKGRVFSFNPALGVKVKKFLKENITEKMIFIYGGYDTWSAAAVEDENFTGKNNMFKYVCPEGDHGTFIRSFTPDMQQEIKAKLNEWLGNN